jgi:hypothetical protein
MECSLDGISHLVQDLPVTLQQQRGSSKAEENLPSMDIVHYETRFVPFQK